MAFGLAPAKACGPAGRKNRSFLPQIASNGKVALQLNIHVAGPGEHRGIQGVALWRDCIRIGRSHDSLSAESLGTESLAYRLPIFGVGILPVPPDGLPRLPQTFSASLAVLPDDGRLGARDVQSRLDKPVGAP